MHERTFIRITTYLVSMSIYVDLPDINQQLTTRGIFYNPDIYKVIECYVDANIADEWAQADSDNAENFMSCTGYVITYAEFPLLWCSMLQT